MPDLLDLCALANAVALVIFGLAVWYQSLPPKDPYPRGSVPLTLRRRARAKEPRP
jgi:hypothetical protein